MAKTAAEFVKKAAEKANIPEFECLTCNKENYRSNRQGNDKLMIQILIHFPLL